MVRRGAHVHAFGFGVFHHVLGELLNQQFLELESFGAAVDQTRHFADAEQECGALLDRDLALPAYDHCIKASHLFNLLDARGVISVTERASYIGRVRTLAKGCCEKWVAGETTFQMEGTT